MKNIFKTFLAGLVLMGFVSSCEESTLPIDSLYDNVDTSGAFIRTIIAPSSGPHNISGGNFPNTIDATIEVQEGNGSGTPTFTEVRVYLSTFNDQDQIFPTLDNNGNELGEEILATLPASEFTPSEVNGLPSNSFSIPTQTVIDNYPTGVFTIPTFIYIRLELQLADGRVFTDTNVGPTVATGNYFDSPFFYNIIFLNF